MDKYLLYTNYQFLLTYSIQQQHEAYSNGIFTPFYFAYGAFVYDDFQHNILQYFPYLLKDWRACISIPEIDRRQLVTYSGFTLDGTFFATLTNGDVYVSYCDGYYTWCFDEIFNINDNIPLIKNILQLIKSKTQIKSLDLRQHRKYISSTDRNDYIQQSKRKFLDDEIEENLSELTNFLNKYLEKVYESKRKKYTIKTNIKSPKQKTFEE